MDSQRCFCEFHRHAKKSKHQHPEYSTGTTQTNRTCYPHQIAGTHRGSQCRTQGSEGRNASVTGRSNVEKAANRLRKKPQLDASGANRQPYPNAKNQNQHGSTPQQFIQAIQNVCHTCPPSISLFRGNYKKKI